MYLFRWRKGQRDCAIMLVYVWEHIFSLYYRTAWWIVMKIGGDEVPIAPPSCSGFSARSAQGHIQGGAQIGKRGPHLQSTFSSDKKATSTNRMDNSTLKAFWKKYWVFFFLLRNPFRGQFFTSFPNWIFMR